jgi:ubiquinone/menaquinone biosynthesis C-methylase UbiE
MRPRGRPRGRAGGGRKRPGDTVYLHGTARPEQDRLSVMNDLLNAASLREMDLRGGERILDVGSGLAQFARAMARRTGPSGRVVAVERSREQIATAIRLARADGEEGLVELRQGQAPAVPLRKDEWGTFDVAHARFLLEHVPDPLTVVRAMVRAVRPGGRIVLQDDNHDTMRLYPKADGFERLWKAYMQTYQRLGNDPHVGHRLVSLLCAAGATPRRATWIFYGGCRGNRRFGAHVETLIGVLESARATIVEAGLLRDDQCAQGIEALRAWGRRPDAAMWFSFSWAEGLRP